MNSTKTIHSGIYDSFCTMRELINRKASWLCTLCFLFAFITTIFAEEPCDKTKCKGTIKLYEDLKCKPVYANKDDCCATRYDCSNLTSRPKDKCYANGHAYELGEDLKEKDRISPCDQCKCLESYTGDMAKFNCAFVDCPFSQPQGGCYFRNDLNSCCGREEVCQKKEDRAKCQVDGHTYLDGESFKLKSDPDVYCQCMEGYKGENVEPFCKPDKCGTELRHFAEIRRNCAPVFFANQSPRTDCHIFQYRCQNDNDTVLPSTNEKSTNNVPDEMKCKFGNIRMLVGEELNQATDYNSVCVKCVCEVPPFPTCQRLADDECDVTNHPPFSQFAN